MILDKTLNYDNFDIVSIDNDTVQDRMDVTIKFKDNCHNTTEDESSDEIWLCIPEDEDVLLGIEPSFNIALNKVKEYILDSDVEFFKLFSKDFDFIICGNRLQI